MMQPTRFEISVASLWYTEGDDRSRVARQCHVEVPERAVAARSPAAEPRGASARRTFAS